MHNNRYLIWLSFDGATFCGWQVQPNGNTVQQTLNDALGTLLRIPVETVGAGRTDTGVHAKRYAAHFDLPQDIVPHPEQLVYKLNRLLPSSIAVQKIVSVSADFHARYSAANRTYHYKIHTQKDPFLNNWSWFIDRPLDLQSMQKAALLLLAYNDFQCFSRSHTDVKNYLCNIQHAEWSINHHIISFEITANRFLRNMVRAIVGTLVEVGLGKKSVDDFEKIILSKDRKMAGYSAPAHGLYLADIEYPESYFA